MLFAVTLAIAGNLLKAPTPDISVDLFLVADNPKGLENLDWLGKETQDPIQLLLKPVVKALDQSKTPFLIIDGGTCTTVPGARKVDVIHRNFSGYDSMTQSVTKNGKTKTQVLANTQSVTTLSVGMTIGQVHGVGYVNQSFVHFGQPGQPDQFAAIQDLTSYDTCLTSTQPVERESVDNSIVLGEGSIRDAKQALSTQAKPFNGICLCPRGFPDAADKNFAAFPPAGMVIHYKLVRQSGLWGLQFVENLCGDR